MRHLYKISPLPPGITTETLQQFSSEIGWGFRPLKRLRDSVWLIGADTPRPSEFISLAGQPILIELAKPTRAQFSSPVFAGTVDVTPTMSKGADPWEIADPWSKANTTAQPNHASQAARAVPGPVQSSLSQQSGRIDQLEQQVEALKLSQTQLENTVKDEGAKTEAKFNQFQIGIQKDMSTLATTLQNALEQSMNKRDQQIRSSFDEIKGLLASVPKRKAEGSPKLSPMKTDNDEL